MGRKTNTVTLLVLVLATTVKSEVSVVESTGKPEGSERHHKLFLYGRKFELPQDAAKGDKGDGLFSPIITSPIRMLPSETANQNEILRDFLSETTEGTFNKTYFSEEVKESENHGGEATTEKQEENSSGEVNGFTSGRSRQDGDRSLLVVFPFKADEDNIEELFTKRPMVKVIETSEEKSGINLEGTPAVREREIVPTITTTTTTTTSTTTEKLNFPTRKRWRPSKRYTTTTEPFISETTTENGEEATKTYTNYNDVEMITKKYENLEFVDTITNHKFAEDFVTPYPVKRFRNKIKIQEEKTTTTEKAIENQQKESKQKLKRKGLRRKTTTTTEGPPNPEELSKVLDILPPDMKDLILQIGLNQQNKEEQANQDKFRFERVPHPTIDPQSYAIFKPLPIEGKGENRNFVPDDMKDFLASFGLLPTGRRVQKSLNPETPEPEKKPSEAVSGVDLEFLPDDLKTLLEDMGLVKYTNKKEPTRIHIFNPSNHSIAHSEEDFEKLNAILSSIKTTVNDSQSLTPEMQSEIIEKIRDLNNLRYKNGNLSEINNEIKKIVVNNKTTTGEIKPKTTAKRATKLFDGPDPLIFSEETILKNDVKRQDNVGATSSSSASSSSSSSSSSASSSASSSEGDASASASSSASASDDSATTTTTEEPPNIEALKESFGGGETASDDADVESSLPPKRPNGLYLLLDWNSFLEVGTEDDARRVNLRFQPKIGDSRNFLPVSVP